MYILNFLPKFCLAREATLEMLKMASSEEKNAMPAAIHCHDGSVAIASRRIAQLSWPG